MADRLALIICRKIEFQGRFFGVVAELRRALALCGRAPMSRLTDFRR